MPRLYVVLDREEGQALSDLALRTRRSPREQASYMIAQDLATAGVLPLDVTEYREVSTERAPDAHSAAIATSSPGPEAA